MLSNILATNFIKRNLGQRLIEIMKLYKPQTHEPRVLSYGIECVHFFFMLMELITPKDAKEPRKFEVVRFVSTRGPGADVTNTVTINTYLAQLCEFTVIQNLLTMLERYHQTNEQQLYQTCKLLKRIVRAHPANMGVFFNLRWFKRMHMIMKSEFVMERPAMFRDVTDFFALILQAFLHTSKKNKLVFTELLLNTHISAKERLADNYEVWEGIVNNYSGVSWQKRFEQRTCGKTYEELMQELKEQKKGNIERVWTTEEDAALGELMKKFGKGGCRRESMSSVRLF